MLQLPVLLTSINNSIAEQTLREISGLFELKFPDRIRGWYVEGSFADGSFVDSSDLDVLVVFKGILGMEASANKPKNWGNTAPV